MHEKALTVSEPPLTALERVDPRVKVLGVLVWAVCVVSISGVNSTAWGGYGVMLLALIGLGYRNFWRFARRFVTAVPFIVVLVALLPFFREGEAVWRWGPLVATRPGVAAAAHVGASALLCVAAVCLVWATTAEAELIAGLRGLGVPASFVGVVAFMLRYLHVLRPELHRLWDARAARALGRSAVPIQSAGNLLGAFFVRAHERAVRVADAMVARGYDGHPNASPLPGLKSVHALAGAGFIIVVIGWRYSV